MQHAVVLSYEVARLMPYFLVGSIGLFVGILYVLRSIRGEKFETQTEKALYIIQGIGSSMLITWICYEITNYFFQLPLSVCVAISGGVGYLGAETLSSVAIKSLEKRL
ncbi:phage holin family protein [Helicobacter acinonychis]|uniref:phage holin family protein n=1 Tax=Helicobacter acinonychis TaxID=212 RepID=UPI00156D4A2E|nr:phage holin family protein [Helicobacter acinonychis]